MVVAIDAVQPPVELYLNAGNRGGRGKRDVVVVELVSVAGSISIAGVPAAVSVSVRRVEFEAVAVAARIRRLSRRIEEAGVERQRGEGTITPGLDIEDAQSGSRRHQQNDSESDMEGSGQGQDS
jgi:hypothetical protein